MQITATAGCVCVQYIHVTMLYFRYHLMDFVLYPKEFVLEFLRYVEICLTILSNMYIYIYIYANTAELYMQ